MSNYTKRRLSKKEAFDIATMMYFIPRMSSGKHRVYPNDKKKMADLSSKGIKPKQITEGFELLQWGKTYRDEQITAYKRDISLGYITKSEILESYPKRLKGWIWSKIKDVPYDVDGETSKMFVSMYRGVES